MAQADIIKILNNTNEWLDTPALSRILHIKSSSLNTNLLKLRRNFRAFLGETCANYFERLARSLEVGK